jgi:antitoxin HicB
MWAYPINLAHDDNGSLLVTCPDLPEVTTFGENSADARIHALAAIEEALAARMASREAIPVPGKGRVRVALPAEATAKVLLYRTMRARGVSKSELARRLGWHRPQVDRLLNLNHATRMDAVEAAFAVLGARLSVAVERQAA